FSAQAAIGPPANLAMVSGDEQVGEAFAPLADPLVVEVTDRFGNPVEGVTVHWNVMAGRGTLSAEAVESDESGRAQVTWTLGFFLGTQRVDAMVDGVGGSPVTFRAGLF